MPETIDWPTSAKPHRRRWGVYVLIAVVLAIFIGARTAISYWVDLLWFGSLGYTSVFWKSFSLEWGTFAAFAAMTFAILLAAFFTLRHSHAADLPQTHTIYFGGRPVELPVARFLGIAAVVAAVAIAIVTGFAMQAQWPTLALYWNAPPAGSAVDPIFGRPLGFYLFTLPAWQLISGWLMTLAVMVCVLAVLFLIAASGGRALGGRFAAASLPWRGVSIALGFLLVALAIREYIGRFSLLFDEHTQFDGVNYTDAHVTLTGMLFVSAALAIGALIAFASGILKPRMRWLLAAIAPAAACFVVMGLAGWYVNTFVVKPNALNTERPYISNAIAMTRQAYGLDRFDQREFPAETTVAAADPDHNQATLENIRLWDVSALQDTLRQVQEIRTYYDFPGIDIDRYQINGTERQVMLAVRELNLDKLPESSRNWVNDKLIYTHGYGITMNPVNGFSPEGLPDLYLSNMPMQSTVPGLSVTRPEIYFGELTDADVYVKTHQQEFNYPQGESNSFTTYAGTGGIPLGGFLRRALLAFDRGDLTKVPFSDDITAESRLLMRRNVLERVQTLAPFLAFDRDPYIVAGKDGRLSWIIDAYTYSATYPYSAQAALEDQPINYIRNSVKAVVDAYDGTVTFYVFDKDDPILAAWRGIFPGLFKDASTMPADLRAHVRYPELLLSLQAQIYGLYHMTDPEVFFNREDLWNVPGASSSSQGGDQATQPMSPNFVLMTLPGKSSGLEFVEILPFTPHNRNNMIGWIAARSDGAHYGNAVVFDFPKTRLVDGPQQIEARIDQNAQLSSQLTLWNQQGSHVIRGSLLVIPCGQALLYAEPIYLKAQSSPMPELRLVVLALQDRLAYGPNFEAALGSLFGSQTPSLTPAEAQQPAAGAPGGAKPAAPDLNALISQASHDFDDYQKLTAEGKLAEAGQKLDDLKHVLGELSTHGK
ncbi:MAG: UPF0182 family protein [Terracidiphilus sp.]